MVRTDEYFVPMEGRIDKKAELEKLQNDLRYTEGFLESVRKKLSNERFVGLRTRGRGRKRKEKRSRRPFQDRLHKTGHRRPFHRKEGNIAQTESRAKKKTKFQSELCPRYSLYLYKYDTILKRPLRDAFFA